MPPAIASKTGVHSSLPDPFCVAGCRLDIKTISQVTRKHTSHSLCTVWRYARPSLAEALDRAVDAECARGFRLYPLQDLLPRPSLLLPPLLGFRAASRGHFRRHRVELRHVHVESTLFFRTIELALRPATSPGCTTLCLMSSHLDDLPVFVKVRSTPACLSIRASMTGAHGRRHCGNGRQELRGTP